jgi:hypothetical protein
MPGFLLEVTMRQISDLYLTALLRLRGHVPTRVLGDGRRAVWVFEPTPALEADVSGYYAGTILVSARDYAEAVRMAKGEAVNLSSVS